ncbi:transcription termination factor 1-like [Sardina pilchardus]|uniref:transcription termination factor 1-like n=1 Tax=Sardina pilchardus TaxID=27697 RepID=UPI002E13EA01
MTEAELLLQEKKKKKKNKKHRLELASEPGSPQETATEVDSVKTHKHKKKKSKGPEEDDFTPAEVPCGINEVKKKRKRETENLNVTRVMTEESADVAVPQEEEVKKKKKKKKRRIDEAVSAGESTEADVSPTLLQVDSEACYVPLTSSQQKTAKKSKSEKTRKNAPDMTPHLEDAVVQELKEFLPDFPFHNLKKVLSVIKYDLPRFREFKKQGIPVRTGKFTASENKKLQLNVKNFLLGCGIDRAAKLFKPYRFPDEKLTIMRQKRQLGYIRCLCAGIPRCWFTILGRARKMFDEENYMGKFTEDENKALKELHTLHGTNWKTISDKIGRSNEALKYRFAVMSEVYGPWSEVEMKTLLTSVRQLLLERAEPGADGSLIIKKSDLYKKLAWVYVAKQQQTRSYQQCRKRWMEYLTRRMSTGGTIKGRKSLNGQIQLIKALNEMAVEDPADIVWDDLTHLFGNTLPDFPRMRYYQLRLTYVPGWNTMPFCDVIDFLYEKVLPQLEAQLETCEEEDMPCEERQTYKLSEIFPDS